MKLASVAALAAPGIAACAATAQFTLIDDFNDGDFDGWSMVDPTGAGTADASGGSLRLQSLVPLPAASGFGTVLDASTVDPSFANGVYRATASIGNDFNSAGIGARFSINQGLNFYYGFLTHDAFGGSLALGLVSQGGAVLLDAVPLPGFDLGETWNLELGLLGDHLSVSAWPVGDAYPGVMIDHTDGSLAVGAVGLVGGVSITAPDNHLVDVSFDDFQYAVPAPASAVLLAIGLAGRRRR